ncbi:MAG TPA: hypothetical protein ENJ55_02575 [Rhizobiales bacterium]|nr:hypothetical protein [Hyphomicrobiales bacterium]
MFRPFTTAMLVGFAVTALSQTASAGYYRNNGGEPYAIAYCNYYKTRAMFAGRKARAKPHVAKYRRKAIGLWKKYNYCLKDNGWPVQYRYPSYR